MRNQTKSLEKKSNTSYYQKWKKQQNWKFMTKFRGTQEILWKSAETRQSETAEETQIDFKVEKEFQKITNRQEDKKERITEIIIRKAIRRMKNKKAADRLGWKAEWIKEGGEEMVKGLYILFNRIKTKNQIPNQWQLMTLKSMHKGGVRKNV